MPTEAEERYERNIKVIEEFRRTGGQTGGSGRTLLLTTTGARSGRERTVPLAYLPDGDRLLIFGSRAGSDKQPDWYWNLLKNAVVTVEVGAETYQARQYRWMARSAIACLPNRRRRCQSSPTMRPGRSGSSR